MSLQEFPYSIKASVIFNNTSWKNNVWSEIINKPEWIETILVDGCVYDGHGMSKDGKDYYFFAKTYENVQQLKEKLENFNMSVEYCYND
jgi:hypothetical protein